MPNDIARIALVLASDLSAYVTAGPYVMVMDYVNYHAVLALVVRGAQAVN